MNKTDNWTPSKNLVSAIRDVYLGNSTKLDLSKVSAEEWKQATGGEYFQELYENPTKHNVVKIIQYLCDIDINIEDLCSFGNISFVLWRLQSLNAHVNYIIENNIQFNEVCCWPSLQIRPINFQDIIEPVSQHYFETWRGGESIESGGILVNLCDHLGVKIETIAESPAEWNIEECEFAYFCTGVGRKKNDNTDKKILRSFARLFSKPMSEWYPREEWWS